MIPSSIQVIFGTLSVGIFAAIVALLVWWIYEQGPGKFFAWVRARFFTPKPDVSVLAVLFLLLYGFGIIVENLTDHLTDSEKEYDLKGINYESIRDFIPRLQSKILKSEGHHRFVTLFRNCEAETPERCRLGGLGKEYFREHRSYLANLAANDKPFRLIVEKDVEYLKGDVSETSNFEKYKKEKKGHRFRQQTLLRVKELGLWTEKLL